MKFSVTWTENVRNTCYVEIEAESEEEALLKWEKNEYEDPQREEDGNSFGSVDLRNVKQVKK